ncbi:diadenosine tetraphosphatase [Candidatus Pantoea edessiphila]|uniref:Bis(5'-nucleosyl)-tetraphosphatase, symmetrical n=1 Tax=Candidatus Pantoea edessiphila TaxID=2044610 RepID=A0A2P5SY45_9GAMM|nr:bis(5'-nucleosyl)-tetraphosphatase (symmetrical) ApaH [Candidatus Pantoea edessiphila]MBK4775605.1 bis(5'-nucleosyl)-tetraphosphatase (symmetrical) [Pantoea sp. Edef]PPI87254.1 diadenosine tetraphosphatase [Candidatus Pantoea edessiphila]
MSTYLIGDIHGCYRELLVLLKKVNFHPKNDTLWLTGDLVARGPNSLDVLRYIKSIDQDQCVRLVLGNHDLNLLAIYAGIHHAKSKYQLTKLLEAEDIEDLINWLRCKPLIQIDNQKKIIMSHAGITPQWDLKTAKTCAYEIEKILSSDMYMLFLNSMHGNLPNNWSEKLTGLARLRFITNALTRMRYCFYNGQLEMFSKNILESRNSSLKPWFNIKNKITDDYTIIFGHWSALQGKGTPKKIIGLDTGCCWGGKLTLLHWEEKKYWRIKKLTTI